MNNNYLWKWQLDERGFEEVPFAEYGYAKMSHDYVEQYLSPSIHFAHCGWDHCEFQLMKNKYGIEEYVVLYPESENRNGRFYNVSGNSLGAIAEQVWYGVYR